MFYSIQNLTRFLESTENIHVNPIKINEGHALGTGVHTYTKTGVTRITFVNKFETFFYQF